MTFKYHLLRWVRALGLLRVADEVKLALHRIRVAPDNREFLRQHPGYATPPVRLAFDAYNHVSWRAYEDGGARHARMFTRIIERFASAGPLTVLEWGCGPGRIIRHLPGLLGRDRARIAGTDYNRETIAWCRKNLPGVAFYENDLMPPLESNDDTFDIVYSFSVLTHLSEEAQRAWMKEILRVLKPGGLFICTTHGEGHRYLLVDGSERSAFDSGNLVVQGRYAEGKKWYFSFHPARYVREQLLSEFDGVEREPTAESDQVLQEVWYARKPLTVASSS